MWLTHGAGPGKRLGLLFVAVFIEDFLDVSRHVDILEDFLDVSRHVDILVFVLLEEDMLQERRVVWPVVLRLQQAATVHRAGI